MSAVLVERAPAKINLTLRVIGRRADGYHELESLVAFAEIADIVTLKPGGPVTLDVRGPYASACGDHADNLVLKAFAALHERVPGLVGGSFLLEKNLPVAAGIGGGSSDGAAALRLLARANAIASDDPRLYAAARAIGADVPVCLEPKARIMKGVGEQLSPPIGVPRLPAVLVNPGVPLATRDVFSRLSLGQAGAPPLGEVPEEFDAMIAFLNAQGNDLTPAAIACAKTVDETLAALRVLPAARIVRMSGSGSTCFALFSSSAEAVEAARQLQAMHNGWWVCATTLG